MLLWKLHFSELGAWLGLESMTLDIPGQATHSEMFIVIKTISKILFPIYFP